MRTYGLISDEHMQIQTIHRIAGFDSVYLEREVTIDLYLPPAFGSYSDRIPLLLLNDGQSGVALRLSQSLQTWHAAGKSPIAVAAIHSSASRLDEYGTAASPDYAGRGALAGAYSFFITQELLPVLEEKYAIGGSSEKRAVAGFSLGGLAAFDLVWHHPTLFSRVGVFSGSFWWRSKKKKSPFQDEEDRIMHRLVKAGKLHEHLRIWFFAGDEEEKDDRNNNGIIDVIDDTLDLMKGLEKMGYTKEKHFTYQEMKGGKHNETTWAKALPDCLKWLFEEE